MYGRDGPRAGASEALGRSGRGRPIRVTPFGNPAVRPKLLAVGCIHGDECAGRAVLKRVMEACPPVDADVWLRHNLDPDGSAAGTRLNGARRGPQPQLPLGLAAAGAPATPSTRAAPAFRARDAARGAPRSRACALGDDLVPPAVRSVAVRARLGRERAVGQALARAGRPASRRMPWLAGTRAALAEPRFPGTSAFVVELSRAGGSRMTPAATPAAIEELAGYRGENRLALR